MLDRDEDGAKRVADEVGGEHLVADLVGRRVHRRPRASVSSVQADILVNNAGIQHVAPVEDFDPERFAIDPPADARGAVPCSPGHCCPGCTTRGWGRLVHVSSVHGHRASPYKSAYVSRQARARGPVQGDRPRGRRQGRHQQHGLPRLRPHAAGRGADRGPGRSHGIAEKEVLDQVLLARTPVKRLVEPAEVAGLVGFLCGPGTDSMTGSSYLMDGGWTAA